MAPDTVWQPTAAESMMGPGSTSGSLRFRLTAVATIVVAIVLAGTAVALSVIQQRQLTANLDASLEQRADTIAGQFNTQLPDAPIPTNDEDRAIQVVDGRGMILVASTNLVGEAPLANPLSEAADQTITTSDDLPLEDDSYRILTRRIETPAGAAVLHVAENSDDLTEAVATLRAALAIIVPTVLALLAALMWWLTGRTLLPVDRIRSEVDAITATHSGNRVHVPERDDEIGRLAITMNRMLERLDDAAEKQRRFVADAAHELRTPLTRIRTDVEVDLSQPDSADAAATNRAIRDETIGLQHLIDDLLHLARSDSGHSPDRHRPVDLDDIVLDEVREFREYSDTTIDVSGVSAAHLNGDPDQLARAVCNLLSNAIHHSRSIVRVTLAERGQQIELAIADDGPGVPTEQRERIFERFARIDDARTRDEGGTGLGLAITKDIVEQHGGAVTYDPDWPNGARFVVALPVER